MLVESHYFTSKINNNNINNVVVYNYHLSTHNNMVAYGHASM